MSLRLPREKVLACLAASCLALLAFIGAASEPPEVRIPDLGTLDDGAVVRVRGVATDVWSSDSGSLSLVLADIMTVSTVKVVCSMGRIASPIEVHIGDELSAMGQLEVAGGRPVIWANEDDVRLISLSREVLDLRSLSLSWELFVGDRFEIEGIVIAGDAGFRLAGSDGASSICLTTYGVDCSRFLDRRVLVDAVLELKPQTMELALDVYEISLC